MKHGLGESLGESGRYNHKFSSSKFWSKHIGLKLSRTALAAGSSTQDVPQRTRR